MKSTLLLICTLLCLIFFSLQIIQTGQPIPHSAEAYEQVVAPQAAEAYLADQQSFNSAMGIVILSLSSLALAAAFICLFFLHNASAMRWFRLGLMTANVLILLVCAALFGVTMLETMHPEPQCLQLRWPHLESFWSQAIKHVHQAAMFLGLCCGVLSGVNCMAFYLFYRRQNMYNN